MPYEVLFIEEAPVKLLLCTILLEKAFCYRLRSAAEGRCEFDTSRHDNSGRLQKDTKTKTRKIQIAKHAILVGRDACRKGEKVQRPMTVVFRKLIPGENMTKLIERRMKQYCRSVGDSSGACLPPNFSTSLCSWNLGLNLTHQCHYEYHHPHYLSPVASVFPACT